MTFGVEILEYQSTETAEATTGTGQIKITGHGLSSLDMIVNSTRRTYDAERGSRYVGTSGLTADIIPLEQTMAGQSPSDIIRLYKFVDRTNKVKLNTLNVKSAVGGITDASFRMVTTASYIPIAGQRVRIYSLDGVLKTYIFNGVIDSVKRTMIKNSTPTIFLDISCSGMKSIANRRTVRVAYPEGTAINDIVTEMLSYLAVEGVRQASWSASGVTLTEDWVDDAISIAEVLDECCNKTGFQWFIDADALLNFYQDPAVIVDSAYDITDGGTFTDYTNFEFIDSSENYLNKVFFAGGNDSEGNFIFLGSEDFTESTAMQEIVAGTGVFGTVKRNVSVVESDYKVAEAGTTTTQINITAHGLAVGDVIWNATRDEMRQVLTLVSDDAFTVSTVASQVADDDIALYSQANTIIRNIKKLQGKRPYTVTFETKTLDFVVGTKMNIANATLGIESTYYLIEEVNIFDAGGNFKANIKATRRDSSNFSTQRSLSYYDYWEAF